jgi:8-oxo-dGTP diphosphatase
LTSGAFTIITNSNEEVLLVLRRDVPLWDLPGGRIEDQERPSQTAIHESLEETGLHIELDEYQKRYFRQEMADTQYLYHSSVFQGDEIVSGPETRRFKVVSIYKVTTFADPSSEKAD